MDPVLLGGEACLSFEDGGKVLAGGETKLHGDVDDGFVRLLEAMLGLLDPFFLDVIVGGAADFCPELFPECGFAKGGQFGKGFDGWRSLEIVVDGSQAGLDMS